MHHFRFAIMGAGNIAKKFCDAAKLIEGCRVVAVASKSRLRAEKFAAANQVPASYDDYEKMLETEKPDAVYIATTTNAHFPLSMLCLRHRVPVLCEKSMFQNSKEASLFFSEAEKQGVFSMEAMWSRFLPANLKAKSWLDTGRIGTPILAEMSIGFVAPQNAENRCFSAALGGGVAFDLSVYGFELLTFFLGNDVKSTHAFSLGSESGVDVVNLISLQWESGLPAVIKASFLNGFDEKLTLYGRKGSIVIPKSHYSSEAFLFDSEGMLLEHFTDEETKNGFTYEIQECINGVQNGLLESSVISHADTLACAKLFDLIQQNTKGSVPVRFD